MSFKLHAILTRSKDSGPRLGLYQFHVQWFPLHCFLPNPFILQTQLYLFQRTVAWISLHVWKKLKSFLSKVVKKKGSIYMPDSQKWSSGALNYVNSRYRTSTHWFVLYLWLQVNSFSSLIEQAKPRDSWSASHGLSNWCACVKIDMWELVLALCA